MKRELQPKLCVLRVSRQSDHTRCHDEARTLTPDGQFGSGCCCRRALEMMSRKGLGRLALNLPTLVIVWHGGCD